MWFIFSVTRILMQHCTWHSYVLHFEKWWQHSCHSDIKDSAYTLHLCISYKMCVNMPTKWVMNKTARRGRKKKKKNVWHWVDRNWRWLREMTNILSSLTQRTVGCGQRNNPCFCRNLVYIFAASGSPASLLQLWKQYLLVPVNKLKKSAKS